VNGVCSIRDVVLFYSEINRVSAYVKEPNRYHSNVVEVYCFFRVFDVRYV